MNQVTLCGYLGRDFELNYTSNKNAFAKSSLAITEVYKNQKGENEFRTNWIPIVLFGRKAELVSQYLKKGDRFLGTGKIVTSVYTDQNGTNRYSWQVVINSFEFINPKEENKEKTTPIPQNPPKEAMPSMNEKEVEIYIQDYNGELREFPF
ncbi:single-stranded DNA-binding protein [Campylobacter jejuni]|nr:single-stranded DNA-binding protein [Campylobacter jejuni]